ncbi:MAG: electron transfer flavoprotein beta subunit/FixA family protein [Propioniciclava sp.]|uniref:electron transfer flavoprotein subunit beta/FixA family protein n=1 Tax=Propioniciclava sp. TaxID=2038686 RepID=UPI0039E4DDB4
MTVAVAYKWAANPQDAQVGADGTVDWSRAKAAVSEYDPVAIQVGRAVADAAGTPLIGVSVGTSATAGSMAKKAALSRGLDKAVLVADDAVAAWNLTQVAGALARLITRTGDVDLLVTGDSSIDENAKMVPALVAGHLGWPCFQDVTGVSKTDGGWSITQEVAGGRRTVAVTGPAVVAVTTDAAAVKVPGMKDILAAGKKPAETVPVADLALTGVPLQVAARRRPQARSRKNLIVSDAAALAQALRTDGVL